MRRLKKTLYIILVLLVFTTAGCTLFKEPLDKKTGFSESLSVLEKEINDENYNNASESLLISIEKWERVKPFMQVEVDHDIVNDIESELTALSAYIETENKSLALASVRIIINMWSDIGTK